LLNRYVSIGLEALTTRATWRPEKVSGRKGWEIHGLYGGSIRYGLKFEELRPDIMIYLGDEPEQLTLIADFDRIVQPDLIVESKEYADWYRRRSYLRLLGKSVSDLEKMNIYFEYFKPRRGMFIVSRQRTSVYFQNELGHGITLLNEVGFEQKKLFPIIDSLK